MKYNLDSIYDNNFFKGNLQDSTPVAEYLAPIITQKYNIKTVIDLGCSTGMWLRAFIRNNVNVRGYEGSSEALRQAVVLKEYITKTDLREIIIPQKIESVDLVISIEVAEHIEQLYVDNYVSNLTTVFNPKYIIMTAAPPGQGGTGHFNCQPQEYWINKISKNGYDFNQHIVDYLTIKILEGRQWENCPEKLKESYHDGKKWSEISPITRGYNGVWIPFWLPKNLMCFSRRG